MLNIHNTHVWMFEFVAIWDRNRNRDTSSQSTTIIMIVNNNNNNTLKYNKRGESDNIATTIWFVCLFFCDL